MSATPAAETNEARYQAGWFSSWNRLKRRVIRDVLAAVSVRDGGRVLDFGCGHGELTGELATRYATATVEGCDFSPTAVALARQTFPRARFWAITPDEIERRRGQYDLIVTHHVLEHVDDLAGAAATLATLCAPDGQMIHMMPSGNPGGLDWRVARTFVDGIQANSSNRFINEDPGHLRRMTSAEVEALFAPHGFRLASQRFRSHFWGSVEWASQNPLIALRIANPLSWKSRAPLRGLAYTALYFSAFLVRSPVLILGKLVEKANRQFRARTQRLAWWKWAILLPAAAASLVLAPIGVLGDRWIRNKAEREWVERQSDPTGGEMFLVFARTSTPESGGPHA